MRRAMTAAVLMLVASAGAAQVADQEIQRFALAYLTYFPASVAKIAEKELGSTPAGPYLAVQVERTTPAAPGSDRVGVLIDPGTRTVAAGLLFPMPPAQPPVTAETLPFLVTQVLPQALGNYLSTRVKVPWPMMTAKPGAVLFLSADVMTGYGTMHLPLAVSTDGKYVAIGGSWPLDRDPRAVRREALASAYVQWDPGHENAAIKIVEFSDFECPSCKRGWGLIKPVLGDLGDGLRHGLVNWPIVTAHPWAFRAAVAGECIYSTWPERLLDLKEELYRLQDTLTFESLDDEVRGFLGEHGLDKDRFFACYLKDPSIDTVLKQMELGYQLGVFGTPTYYANGESLPWSDTDVFRKRLRAIGAAGGRPESAAEVAFVPKPTPAAGTKPTAAAPPPR